MAASLSHRLFSLTKAKYHLLITSPSPNPNPNPNRLLLLILSRPLTSLPPSQNPNPTPPPSSRSITPLESQFQTWTSLLRPGFTPADVELALRSQTDPDLALDLDLFRWSALSPSYRHTPSTYLAIADILVAARRFSAAESILHDVLAGACAPSLPLFNLLIRFCASRRHLFSTAFDLYKKLPRPDLPTFTSLLHMLLRRLGKPPVSHIHLHSVRSLARRMKASGTIPDAFVLNLLIKAYSRCLEMDEAVRVFREMGLYSCAPDAYSYGYIAKGMCEKGRVDDGVRYYREMRGKGLVPTSSVYMTVVCSLAMERRFGEGREVLEDMLANGMAPDLLTYRTFLEGLCRDGRGDEAFELLEELGKRRGAMHRRVYSDLLEGLHWINQPH